MRISFRSYSDVINVILLIVLIWIYGAGCGHLGQKWATMWKEIEEHHHHHHHEEKSLAIPIPIPVIVKEKGGAPPPYYPPPAMPCLIKSHDKKGHDMKDFIWKMMMIKMMKDKPSKTIIKKFGGKGKGCCGKTKIIKFPNIMKSSCKGCKKKCPKPCPEMPPEEPEEEYPEEYPEEEGPLMGWETSNHAPVFQHPEEHFANGHRSKFFSMATNRRGDTDDVDFDYYGK